ncbi:hypothetical protein L218DRAFT_951092 [Marasmius fiardii PR-910]|nr:hypothetical protein L218DRAFT_951092 [Marasmius fiardii PR-910]
MRYNPCLFLGVELAFIVLYTSSAPLNSVPKNSGTPLHVKCSAGPLNAEARMTRTAPVDLILLPLKTYLALLLDGNRSCLLGVSEQERTIGQPLENKDLQMRSENGLLRMPEGLNQKSWFTAVSGTCMAYFLNIVSARETDEEVRRRFNLEGKPDLSWSTQAAASIAAQHRGEKLRDWGCNILNNQKDAFLFFPTPGTDPTVSIFAIERNYCFDDTTDLLVGRYR